MGESVTQAKAPPVSGGEFAFTWSDFRKIAALVHAEAGIVLTESKANLIYSRLAKRLRAIGLKSFRDYCELITQESGADERQKLIAAMTTNVTRFFREPHHFELLRERVVPDLIAAAKAHGRVRIWSAGCSSGEEPYSIALTLLDAFPNAPNYDVRILASDIDPNMVQRGREGIYSARVVESIPAGMRRDRVQRVPGDRESYRMAPELRDLIRFRELNLLGSWPMTGRFNVIFCRNTMIYFDEPTQDSIWQRFAQILTPGGYLFIGHSERIAVARHPFELIAQTTYRLRDGAGA